MDTVIVGGGVTGAATAAALGQSSFFTPEDDKETNRAYRAG